MHDDKHWLAGFYHHTDSNSSVLGRELAGHNAGWRLTGTARWGLQGLEFLGFQTH